jgi:hypothetical protein
MISCRLVMQRLLAILKTLYQEVVKFRRRKQKREVLKALNTLRHAVQQQQPGLTNEEA